MISLGELSFQAVSKKPDPGPRTSLRLTNLTGPRTSLRLANWSADQFAFDRLVRGPGSGFLDTASFHDIEVL